MAFSRIRRSVALKLILASAVPSAVVLLVGLGALIAYTESVARTDPALAFRLLRQGAVIGCLLTLTFAGIAVAITSRKFLVKPAQQLGSTMARAEMGEILVRAKVTSDDELGRLARSFNTMLARVTDMAAHEIETENSLHTMERELLLKRELTAVNERLAAHIREMELLLAVSKARLVGTPMAIGVAALTFTFTAGFGGLLLPLWWLGVMFHVYAIDDRVVPKEDEGEQY